MYKESSSIHIHDLFRHYKHADIIQITKLIQSGRSYFWLIQFLYSHCFIDTNVFTAEKQCAQVSKNSQTTVTAVS